MSLLFLNYKNTPEANVLHCIGCKFKYKTVGLQNNLQNEPVIIY